MGRINKVKSIFEMETRSDEKGAAKVFSSGGREAIGEFTELITIQSQLINWYWMSCAMLTTEQIGLCNRRLF